MRKTPPIKARPHNFHLTLLRWVVIQINSIANMNCDLKWHSTSYVRLRLPHLCFPWRGQTEELAWGNEVLGQNGWEKGANSNRQEASRTGGSSNLVYPEVPLQENHSKTLVHFPGEKGWGRLEEVICWQTDWKPNLMSEQICHRSNLRWEEKSGDR